MEGPVGLSAGEKVGALVGLLCVLGLLWMLAAFFFYPCLIPGDRACKELRFQPYMKEYASLVGLPQVGQEAYISGPFAVVDIGEAIRYGEEYFLPQQLSSLHFKPEVKGEADKPEQVKTVILLNWGKELVGKYERSGYLGYRPTCEVVVVDRTKPAIVGRKSFRGDGPGQRLLVRDEDKRFGGIFGPTPWREIVDYIQRLPRR